MKDAEPVEGLCNSPKKRGGLCVKPAGWGTDHVGVGHCRLHGGTSPNGRKFAAKLELQSMLRLGGLREMDPRTAALEALARAAWTVKQYEALVELLEPGDLYGPVGGGEWSEPRYEPHVLVRMYDQANDQMLRAAQICHALGIEDQLIEQQRKAVAQGAEVAGIVRRLLEALGLPLDAPEVQGAVRLALEPAADTEGAPS